MTEEAQRIHEKLNKTYIDRDQLRDLILDKQGYAFDSLVFRFKEYQAKAFESDLNMALLKHHDKAEAIKAVQHRHDRDLMKFIQILDNVIGEHN